MRGIAIPLYSPYFWGNTNVKLLIMMKPPVLLLLLLCSFAHSQSYMGLFTDNYSGTHSLLHNPGNLADSRVKWEFNLVGLHMDIATDYTSLGLSDVTTLLGDDGFDGLERFPTDQNNFLLDVDVLGPSVMLSLNEKSGIALLTRVRAISNFNNLNGALFESIYEGFPLDSYSFSQGNLDFTTHAWAEVGLSYGRVLLARPNHMLKGGATIKYLLGGGGVQGSSQTLNGNFDAAAGQVALNGDFSYALTIDEEGTADEYFQDLAPGLGADIGFVYEYRDRRALEASNANNPRAFNQYRFKVGLSIVDIGSINYKDTETTDYTANLNANAQDLENDFITVLEDNSATNSTIADTKFRLPTALHLNFDYSVTPKVYLNLNLNQGLIAQDDFFANNRLNLITLTPRYESRIFGAYLPISHSSLSKTSVGLGFRLGPLVVGSGSIITNLTGKSSQLANVFLGLKIPVYHKRKI